MIPVIEERPQSVALVQTKISLADQKCSPARLLIVVNRLGGTGGTIAHVTRTDSRSQAFLPSPIPWAWKTAEINSWVRVLQARLETFREKWSRGYLDDIEDSKGVGIRLEAFQPLCDWSDPPSQADENPRRRWEQAARSTELRNLANAGRELYLRIFGADPDLKAWADGLPAGSRLTIYWKREDQNTVTIPWTLLYREELPTAGGAINPLAFLGLSLRLEYVESWSISALGLGSPDKVYRGHLFFWKGKGPDYDESQGQYASWKIVPKFYAVPDGWPPAADDTTIKELAKRLLAGDDPSPMTLLYLYCQCTVKDTGPELYFGAPVNADVTISVDELPSSGTPFPYKPLVFINACSSDSPMSPGMTNLLESNFLERGCRAYLGTVNRIPIRVASRFAQAFFHFFLPGGGRPPLPAGEAVSQARLFLWTQYNNIAGLYYNYINHYEIFMEANADVVAAARGTIDA